MHVSISLWSPQFPGQLHFAALAIAGGLVIETVLPGTGRRNYRALAFNLLVALIFLYLTTLLTPLAADLLAPLRERYALHIPVAFPDGLAGSILQTLAFFFVFDFFFYWWHRAQHSLAPLWAQHKFHHQERWVNVTTVHRYHFTEEPLRQFVIFLPLALLFEFKPVTVAWVWMVFTLWGYWIHMNVRVQLGPLGRWISGPQFHRHHHAPEFEHTNFAAFFPIWDRVFGTYHHPKPNAFPVHTGVVGASDGNNLYDAVVAPFVEWGRQLSRVLRLIALNRIRN